MSQPTLATRARPETSAVPLRTPVKKKSRALLYIILLAVVVVGGVIGAAVYKSKQKPLTQVTTEKAVVKTIVQLVSATGKIQPEVEVKISPEVSGEIVEFPFKEGAQVKKGQLLVKIKPDNYVYLLEQRQADLAATLAMSVQSKSRLQKAESDFHRSKDLFEKKLISESDYTTATSAFEVAQADQENALAQIRGHEGLLKQAQDQLQKTTIESPIDGTVSSRTSELGERVVATGQFTGTEVMRIANLDAMEARVNVNENDVVNVKIGDRARVTIDAFPGRKFSGVVKEIASTAKTLGANTQEEITNFEVRIRVEDHGVSLRPGMSANADIETQTVTNVITVPIQAVTVRTRQDNKTPEQVAQEREKKDRENQGNGPALAADEKQRRERDRAERDNLQRVVFLREGDHVKQVAVTTGIADTTSIEIKSGIKEGDEVVSGSYSVILRVLKEGMQVKLNTPKPEVKKP